MEVQNITATGDLGCFLKLKDVALQVPNSKFNDVQGRCFGLTLKLKNPKATVRIFHTGKVVCLGTKSHSDLKNVGQELLRLLDTLIGSAEFTGFTINNMVGSCDIGHKLDLGKLYETIGGKFEPELFPAFHYCTKNKTTLLIFQSGKVIATGAKQIDDLNEAHAHIFPILQRFQK